MQLTTTLLQYAASCLAASCYLSTAISCDLLACEVLPVWCVATRCLLLLSSRSRRSTPVSPFTEWARIS
jgi:hypothetical protein